MPADSIYSIPAHQLSEYSREQLPLFAATPFLAPARLASVSSQRWIQAAVEYAPEALLDALRPVMKLETDTTIDWSSPRAMDGFREFRDKAALELLGIHYLPYRRLEHFWPPGGPVWDALGKTSTGEYLFLEAKAHRSELFTPATQAKFRSRWMIEHSLSEAREYYCSGANADWSGIGYQYANRLAFHYLFRILNGLPSNMIFLYFVNAGWVPRPVWRRRHSGIGERTGRPRLAWTQGPVSAAEWQPAIVKLHSRLGLPPAFESSGVHTVFMDALMLSKRLGIPLYDEELLVTTGLKPL